MAFRYWHELKASRSRMLALLLDDIALTNQPVARQSGMAA
jgi:hypothetical protein